MAAARSASARRPALEPARLLRFRWERIRPPPNPRRAQSARPKYHDEFSPAMKSQPSRLRLRRTQRGRCREHRDVRTSRQANAKRRAAADSRVHRDRTVMEIDRTQRKRKAETGSSAFGCEIEVEHFCAIGG